MTKRIYPESVKKWLIANTIASGTLVGGIFIYLIAIGAITVTGHSDDMACAGTTDDYCLAYINFTANEDIFLYQVGADPWGRNTMMQFDPNVKEWEMFRSWGSGWRKIDLDTTCKGTWCGGKYGTTENKYSFAFREGRDYEILIRALKNEPEQVIKWGAFIGEKYEIDPVWLGVDEKEVKPKKEPGLISTDIAKERGWKITKTGDEVNLGVSYTLLNDTATEFCIDMNDKSKYEYDTYLDKDNTKEFPVEIQRKKPTDLISSSIQDKIDISTAHSGNEECFIVDYEIDEDVSLKLGWDSIVIDSNTTVTALRFPFGEKIVKDSNGYLYVVWRDANTRARVANSSDNGATWTVSPPIDLTFFVPDLSIAIDSNDNLFFFITNATGSDTVVLYNSSDNAATWVYDTIVASESGDTMADSACVADSNDIIHCCVSDLSDDHILYTNSSNWNTMVGVSDNSANDGDECVIEVDRADDCVYIVATGSDQDDVDIWSPCLDGWGDANRVPVVDDFSARAPSITIDDVGMIYVTNEGSAGLYFSNSTNGRNWTTVNPDTPAEFSDVVATEDNDIYIFYDDFGDSVKYANSSDGGVNWNITSVDPVGYDCSAHGTSFPSSNRITNRIHYVWQNSTGIIYANLTVPFITPVEPGGANITITAVVKVFKTLKTKWWWN